MKRRAVLQKGLAVGILASVGAVFALKKGRGPSGVLLKPDGEPASGAKVYLTDLRSGIQVQDKRMKVRGPDSDGTWSTVTDRKGRFSFPARDENYALLVLEDEGFAQVLVRDLNVNPEIRLQPWAKVQGTLMIGSKPGANETVRLSLVPIPYEHHPRVLGPLSLLLRTQTDDTGNFSFDRVPPLAMLAYHSPKPRGHGMGAVSQSTNFSLRPGETKSVALGGSGRPVTGQLVVHGGSGNVDWYGDTHSLESVLPPAGEIPDLSALHQEQSSRYRAADSDEERDRLRAEFKASREDALAKLGAFYQTEKGRELYFQNRRYALNIAPGGSFRIEDVPGGKYRLRMVLRERGGDAAMRPPIARLDREFDIPDSPDGRTDEPFNLGTVEIEARRILAIGDPAPDFEVPTVEAQTLRLSDLAGKYVLLDFWAVWCGPCVAETPHLKAVHEAFKDHPRFRMIGLSLDSDINAPRVFAKKHDLGWVMGFLGEWSKTDLPNQYGVSGIPSLFFIGPDGKILAKDLRGEDIKATVERILAKEDSIQEREESGR